MLDLAEAPLFELAVVLALPVVTTLYCILVAFAARP
jgi:hypothetical protein